MHIRPAPASPCGGQRVRLAPVVTAADWREWFIHVNPHHQSEALIETDKQDLHQLVKDYVCSMMSTWLTTSLVDVWPTSRTIR
jgi:hypothetical protein